MKRFALPLVLALIFGVILTACGGITAEDGILKSEIAGDAASDAETGEDKTEIISEGQISETTTAEDTEENVMYAYCGSNKLTIELADNASAKAFAEKLKDGDISVTMDDYGDFEKVGSLGFSIVQSNTQITTSPGDVILYQGNSLTPKALPLAKR